MTSRRSWPVAAVLVLGGVIGILILHHHTQPSVTSTFHQASVQVAKRSPPNPCSAVAAATLDVLVSVAKRHLWACDGSALDYDSPVITGMENIPADLTPIGTYHVYAKYTNQWLRGSDSTGSWNDHVSYWMPFLDNQYGTYGFHDATWRPDSAFGNVDPYSANASHGCVELPLATAKWIYGWAAVGTTVTIEA